MSKTIEAKALTKRYPPDVQALDGLDLEVEEGTIFALLGPNGAGKSTTVKILTTLTRPDAGEAQRRRVRRPRRSRTASAARSASSGRSTASTPRRPAARTSCSRGDLRPRGPGAEAAASTSCSSGSTSTAAATAAGQDLLGRHAAPARHRDGPAPPARGALPRRADDGLDPEARVDMWEEIERLAREEKMTILLTTHYLDEADELAAQVAIVDRGRIVARARPRS